MIYFALVLALATSAYCDQRIVGGDDVTSTSFAPWQASLQVSGSHFCGGSLISATKVMSACHCKQTSLTVVLGTLQYTQQSAGQSFVTTDFLCHPQYSRFTIDYDYAIVTLPRAASLNSGVQPITVASGEYAAGTEALMTGWGKTSGSSSLPITMQYAYTYLISEAECKATWGNQVTARMQCANDNTNSACNGDSGGPLAVQDNGVWMLVGNTSWGVNGCATSYPSAWSKNSAVYSWIQTNAGI